jgi:hypothetical protein
LVSQQKYEDAFTTTIRRGDMSLLSWLCYKVKFSILYCVGH